MMNMERSVECEWAGETAVLGEKLPQCTLSTLLDLSSNPDRRGGNSATDCLSYGAAL